MIINHNLSSINANRTLNIKYKETDKSMEKLASGIKINRAADDAANLAVSEKLRTQIRGLNQAMKNVENGVSFVQTTEGYMNETTDLLQRIRELAIQASNGIYTQEDRDYMQVEVSQLVDEIQRVAVHAQFNKVNMLTGTFSSKASSGQKALYLHVGANMDQTKPISIDSMQVDALGVGTPKAGLAKASSGTNDSADTLIKLNDPADALKGSEAAIGVIDNALQLVNKQRADLGAFQNRFETAYKGLAIAAENMQAAESLIRDTNMAEQMVDFVKNSILVQAGTAMLAQANQKPQSVLQLLG